MTAGALRLVVVVVSHAERHISIRLSIISGRRRPDERVMSADVREMVGELFIVATPIGHLDDITLRAVRVLSSVEMIAAEDTRHTRRLLQHHDIQPRRLVAVHEHNEGGALAMVLDALTSGDVALVSDAGTPKLSDPGHELVRAAWEAGAVVRPIPGASSLTAALSVTALPAQDALFAGFLPSKAGQRAARLDQLAAHWGPVVLFEAPHRVLQTLTELAQRWPERQLCVARELTKQHETVLHGTAQELLPQLELEHRGEFVLILDGLGEQAGLDGDLLARELAGQLPPRAAARVVAKVCGGDARSWYDRIRAAKQNQA